jgi:small subunit ribosomal protein S6e
MAFKINVSDKGKTYKAETESETLVGRRIGEKIPGGDVVPELEGYELEITGTSDISGIPGFKGLSEDIYHRRLLRFGPGMKDRRKGIRLKKTLRGEMISPKTIQVNTRVLKEGKKKFAGLFAKEESASESKQE